MSLPGRLANTLIRAQRSGIQLARRVAAAPFLFRAYRGLAKNKERQRALFSALAAEFSGHYDIARKNTPSEFLVPEWELNNQKVEATFLRNPPFDFLNDPTIAYTMSVGSFCPWVRQECQYLEKRFPRRELKSLLQEDPTGAPRLAPIPYCTSGGTVHGLHHLAQFFEKTGADSASLKTVIEWGGGYGNLAKTFRRLRQGSTYCVIDTPLFSCIQWLYLSTVIGKENVHLVTDTTPIAPGKINLIPLGQLAKVPPACDLFISMWALSESSQAAQRFVIEHNWFGATHLLLGYQSNEASFPTAQDIGRNAAEQGAYIRPIPFLPGSSYAFK